MTHGDKLGRYRIVSKLGQGAMGMVYEAIDSNLDRAVALKSVRIDRTNPDYKEFRARFLAEAKSAGRLSHPNIVTIHDFGEVNDTAYIAMELLRGETLRTMMNRQRFPIRRAVRYAVQIADGLAAAHRQGVVHRDIKPANVLRMSNGLLKIMDFGIAHLPSSHLTQDGALMGTPKYMSPEQVRGLRVDGRSDIFSLGVMLYEMLTGTLPFVSASLSGLMYQIVDEQPIHPGRWNSEIPDALARIVAKCLVKEPEQRYQSADELAQELRLYRKTEVAVDAPKNVFLPLDPAQARPLEALSTTFESTIPSARVLIGDAEITRPGHALALSPPDDATIAHQLPPTIGHRRGLAIALAGAAAVIVALVFLVPHWGNPTRPVVVNAVQGSSTSEPLNASQASTPVPAPTTMAVHTPANSIPDDAGRGAFNGSHLTAPSTPHQDASATLSGAPVQLATPVHGTKPPRRPTDHAMEAAVPVPFADLPDLAPARAPGAGTAQDRKDRP